MNIDAFTMTKSHKVIRSFCKSSLGLYSPLVEKDEIRLLHLQPISGKAPIKCTVTHAKLEEDIKYEALSYMWGSTDSKIIEISGFEVPVRINLWNALYHLAPRAAFALCG